MTEITSRASARAKNAKSYFTGEPCRNGHIAPRYTQSGTCRECIAASNRPIAESSNASRRSAKAKMTQARFRLHDVDFDLFLAAAWGVAVMREPVLLLDDIRTRFAPTDKAVGTALYTIMCFHDDVCTLRDIAAGMVSGHRVDVAAKRREVIGSATFEDTTPEINFK